MSNTVKIKLLQSLSGMDYMHPAGTVVSVDPKEAKSLISAGIAEIEKGNESAENAATRTRRGRRSKPKPPKTQE